MVDALLDDPMLAMSEACFHLYFRKAPFGEKHAVVCGTHEALEFLSDFELTPEEADYLLDNGVSEKLVSRLREVPFASNLEVYALPEGTFAAPNEPIMRIQGPLWKAQLIETVLLNIVNFQTLIATKARRVVEAAKGRPVFEFGLRRAQGPDGGLMASRAAYVGGCAGTSNVQAGMMYGLPIVGTHAHSWVMAHSSEFEAFKNYAMKYPDNTTLLIDTYDVAAGVENAIVVGQWLAKNGHALKAVRLDSGDLVELSRAVRHRLDEAGLKQTKIIVSNDLDEHAITKLLSDDAPIDMFGVGTKLVTAYDQPALGGVYKLAAIRGTSAEKWRPCVKNAEPAKRNLPMPQEVLHVTDRDKGTVFAHLICGPKDNAQNTFTIGDVEHTFKGPEIAFYYGTTLGLQRGQLKTAWFGNLEHARTRCEKNVKNYENWLGTGVHASLLQYLKD